MVWALGSYLKITDRLFRRLAADGPILYLSTEYFLLCVTALKNA